MPKYKFAMSILYDAADDVHAQITADALKRSLEDEHDVNVQASSPHIPEPLSPERVMPVSS